MVMGMERTGVAAGPIRRGWARWIPLLSGFATVGLVFAAHLFHGAVPSTRTPAREVAVFYRTHASGQLVGGFLLVIAAFAYLAFAGVVRRAVQRSDGEAAASTLGLAGAVLFAVGVALFAGIGAALGDGPARMDPVTLQTLNLLYNDLYAPIALGIAVGVGVLTPASMVGFLGLGVWVLIVSVMLTA